MLTNEKLKDFLRVILNKEVDSITPEEIANITTVRISTRNDNGEHLFDFNDLHDLPKLERVIIADSLVRAEEIKTLSSLPLLKSIDFEHAAFVDESLLSQLANVKILSFNNCLIRDYAFLKESLKYIVEINIINPYDETELDLSLLNDKLLLSKLCLERVNIVNYQEFGLPNLETLSLLNSSIDSFDFIPKCPKLSVMFLPERYLNNPVVKDNQTITFKTNLIEYTFEEEEVSQDKKI